jgi:hypothetical protein
MTEPNRDRLHGKLREVLGDDNAGTLIEMLPPDRDNLATKADITGLDQRMDALDQRMEKFDQRMEKFEDRLWDFHEALRAQTRVFATITVTAMLGVGSLSFAAAALL